MKSTQTIGIIGQGFVGSAVREGMKNHFTIKAYDKDASKYSNVASVTAAVHDTDVTFVCVPTPMKRTGECDLSILMAALQQISECVYDNQIVVIKSTVPPGTTEQFNQQFANLDIVFNPEFLTEANAVEDYKNQNRIILGGPVAATSVVKRCFERVFPKVPVIKTSSTIAEMIKYVTNTFLATKISFANEMYQICQGLDIDYDKVIEYARYDDRLGHSHWSVPGPDGDFGFGGHCFPKDIAALAFVANQLGVDKTMLVAAMNKNITVRTDLDWTRQVGRAVSED